MEPRISFVTLGVTDLVRATRFHAEGLRLPRLKSPPTVSFFELGLTWLALYPRDLLAADAGVSPHGSGFPDSLWLTTSAPRPRPTASCGK
jgi:uncharacterized protein